MRATARGRRSRDRLLAAHLERLLDQLKRTTFVIGESDYLTIFVATALGHSFTIGKAKDGSTAGLDAHEIGWFIPAFWKGRYHANMFDSENEFNGVLKLRNSPASGKAKREALL